MSKGNMLLGHARGKVGSLVFARVKGQQTTRARNFSPANPRTASQMYQRALFSDAVKFFTRGRRNLFQFAFEDKKTNESDYNAFMRNNAKRGVVISKEAFDLYGYPALGNWLMTKGSLQPVIPQKTTQGGGGPYLVFNKPTSVMSITTLGELSQFIVDGDEWLDGDIITFVTITFSPTSGIPAVTPPENSATTWEIAQVQLDLTSTQPLTDFNVNPSYIAPEEPGDNARLELTQAIDGLIGNQAYVIVHSRNTATGLRVSTQELQLTADTAAVVEAARERSYTDAVVESWRATQKAPVVSEAILQGSIAQSIALDFQPAGE